MKVLAGNVAFGREDSDPCLFLGLEAALRFLPPVLTSSDADLSTSLFLFHVSRPSTLMMMGIPT